MHPVALAFAALAAAPHQLRDRVVNHRLGVATEIVESAAALTGALVSGIVSESALAVVLGLVGMASAGLIAGLSGVSGGFIRTPATTEIMLVPIKVAAATTTFTVGVTSAVGLLVFAAQGRIVPSDAALVAAAALVGGTIGSRLQSRLAPQSVRRGLSVVLVVIGVLLLVKR